MHGNPKLIRLLENLRDATAKGRLEWEETVNERAFRLVLDYATLRISVFLDDAERQVFSADLMNEVGREVDSVTAEEGPVYDLLADLYELARRRARGTDELIERMLSDRSLSA